MAKLAGVFASSHAPLIIRGWKDVKPADQQDLRRALTELARRIKAARPDVLVEIAPDHWVNFFIDNLPGICIGMGEEHEGPAEPWMKDCPFKKISGHPKLANHILQTAIERDFEPSVSHHLTLDHGFCIPLWKGGLDPLPPIVPIIINDLEPPYPSVRRRSEEHTSELQSPCNLVCRLLLEKKKRTKPMPRSIQQVYTSTSSV